MRKALSILALVGVAAAAGGCGLAEDVGSAAKSLTRTNPNRLDVGANPPLTLPPDYALRPPQRGTARGTTEARRKAATVLKTDPVRGKGAKAATMKGRSSSEAELLLKAGFSRRTSGVVRKTVNIETKRGREGQKKFVDKLIKYQSGTKSKKKGKGRDATSAKPVIKGDGEL